VLEGGSGDDDEGPALAAGADDDVEDAALVAGAEGDGEEGAALVAGAGALVDPPTLRVIPTEAQRETANASASVLRDGWLVVCFGPLKGRKSTRRNKRI
jgi:hypothetical protein